MKNKNTEILRSKLKLTKEQKRKSDLMAQESVDALNKAVLESEARHERWNVIWEMEIKKWPHGLGKLSRQEVPDNLQKKLDECIEKSQVIAREACQTEETLNKYLDENIKDRK